MREPLSTTPNSSSAPSASATPRRSVPACASQTSATRPHSRKLLSWFGWRRLPTARPTIELRATSVPSAQPGANTCTSPIAAPSTPATSNAMQKARNAAGPRPDRCSAVAQTAANPAAKRAPADESASDHGKPVHSGDARPASNSRPSAAHSGAGARAPRSAPGGRPDASTSSQMPQPTSAAA